MKIVNTSVVKTVKFKDLEEGAAFKSARPDRVYIKIEEVRVSAPVLSTFDMKIDLQGDTMNAIMFRTDRVPILCNIFANAEVTPLEVEVHIK